jgi:NTE family protein
VGDGGGPRLPRRRALSTALVLGAGGTVGLAYHAGTLRALHEVGGFDPASADLIVGTSAGSVIAAYLRTGRTTAELWELALSGSDLPPAPVTPRAEGSDGGSEDAWLPDLFVRSFATPVELVRRSLGSAYVLSRSVVRAPIPVLLPAPVRRAFPAGLFEMSDGRQRLESELPAEWPARPLWLCALDIVTGRRVVLGRRHPPRMSLAQAVMSSCAIPGVYPPVRYGRRELIDGGAHSTTNLDLAARFGADLVIGVVPMGFDPSDPPGCVPRLVRRLPNRTLDAELGAADRAGSQVLLLRPGAREAALHGFNMMRSADLAPVAQAAFDATARMIDAGGLARLLESAA